jgi:hypothetical protein
MFRVDSKLNKEVEMGKARPIGVILLAIWFFFQALGEAVSGGVLAFFIQDVLGMMNFGLTGLAATTIQIFQVLFILIGVLLLGGGLGYGISAFGLLTGKEWGRVIGIIACTAAAIGWFGMFMPFVVVGRLMITPLIIGIIIAVINALPILYLISEEVRQYTSESFGTFAVAGTIQASLTPPVVTVPPAMPTYPQPSQPQPRLDPTHVIGAAQPPAAWLVGSRGNRAGKQFGLQRGRNTIGRDGTLCEVVVDDPTVSKRHAEVRYENGQFILYDLASTNGTFVNNNRVQRQNLLDGDEVRIGNIGFVFKVVKMGPTR